MTIETTPEWVTYLDLEADVKPWLQVTHLTDLDVVLTDIIDMSCHWVQNYLDRPVAPTQFFRRFDGWSGWNGAYIMLPYSPVLKVVSVIEYRATSGAFTLTEQTPANQSAQDCYQIDALRGTLIRTFPGLVQRPFWPGSRNIEVTWTAGYNRVPPDIKVATLQLVNHWYRNSIEAMRTSTLRDLEYDSAPTSAWTGIPNRVTALLDPFTQVGMG